MWFLRSGCFNRQGVLWQWVFVLWVPVRLNRCGFIWFFFGQWTDVVCVVDGQMCFYMVQICILLYSGFAQGTDVVFFCIVVLRSGQMWFFVITGNGVVFCKGGGSLSHAWRAWRVGHCFARIWVCLGQLRPSVPHPLFHAFFFFFFFCFCVSGGSNPVAFVGQYFKSQSLLANHQIATQFVVRMFSSIFIKQSVQCT